VLVAATFVYQSGTLRATLANGEVWRYRPYVNAGTPVAIWVGDTAEDYAPVSAEYFADYVTAIAAGVARGIPAPGVRAGKGT
jgi:hypothetical protein